MRIVVVGGSACSGRFSTSDWRNKSLTTSSVPGPALRPQSTAAFCCQATERALTQGFDTVIRSCKSIIGCWLTLIKPRPGLSMSAISMITAAKDMATATITGLLFVPATPPWWPIAACARIVIRYSTARRRRECGSARVASPAQRGVRSLCSPS